MSYSVLLLGGASLDLAAAALTDEFKIDVCRLAQQAFERMKERKPDLIVLDVELSDMAGMAFLHALRQTEEGKAMPVIAISPRKTEESVRQAFSLGRSRKHRVASGGVERHRLRLGPQWRRVILPAVK